MVDDKAWLSGGRLFYVFLLNIIHLHLRGLPAAGVVGGQLPGLLKGVRLIPSGEHWCDVAAPTADKGNAILEIRKILGFSEDECMAFGDHMNDEGMLRACGHPRAVANAVPAILGLAEKVIPANTEGGVLTELETLLREIGG